MVFVPFNYVTCPVYDILCIRTNHQFPKKIPWSRPRPWASEAEHGWFPAWGDFCAKGGGVGFWDHLFLVGDWTNSWKWVHLPQFSGWKFQKIFGTTTHLLEGLTIRGVPNFSHGFPVKADDFFEKRIAKDSAMFLWAWIPTITTIRDQK